MRQVVKEVLARGVPSMGVPSGATLLLYHRVGGGTPDERDLATANFARQLDLLAEREVLPLDGALDRLDRGDESPSVVLTFDDGFADVFDHAWPLLLDRRMPFTLYLATAYIDGVMRWEGSTAKADGRALSWTQVAQMAETGLCTVANHTHRHVRPDRLTADELDECSDAIERRIGQRPQHFAYPWGVDVPAMQDHLQERFRSAATGEVGRNTAATPRVRLRRIPVRRTDPLSFFAAKLEGLGPERTYGWLVRGAKAVGLRA